MTEPKPGRSGVALLWLAALLVMIASAVWQRLTGPTHPKRGSTAVASEAVKWRLLRSGTSGEPLMVVVKAPPGAVGTLHYRRFPLDEPFREIAMGREGDALVGLLPTQPPAGKLEYFVTLGAAGSTARIPDGEPVVMRFKGDVPAGVLIPHVVAMFFGMMIGVRAALAAALGRPDARRYAWVAVVLIGLGGLVLGPIVQKYAFGAFWTGWPFGGDLTDNKTLGMWLAWVVAVAVWSRRKDPSDRIARWTTVAAALVMVAVYLVPHSLRGSQLDYDKVDGGGATKDAITTGR